MYVRENIHGESLLFLYKRRCKNYYRRSVLFSGIQGREAKRKESVSRARRYGHGAPWIFVKKNTVTQIKRTKRYPVIMIGEGILVGAVSGLIILLYRLLLEKADIWREKIVAFAKGSVAKTALWFVILIALAFVVHLLLKKEPMISGSGIPQMEGEIQGEIDEKWYRVLPAKFLGGFLSLFAGLALGREGPSIQLGSMAGKGISKGLDRSKSEERFLLTCGASAGLSAAFHAPLAGVLFSLEEVHKNFSVSLLIAVMSSSLTADFITSSVLGTKSVFQFGLDLMIPPKYYWMLILLGVILGLGGVFYNWFTLKVQSLYQKATFLPAFVKVCIPFVIAGVLAFTLPDLLGSGHELIQQITHTKMLLGTMLIFLIGRFIFSAVSFGSGVPGGIFFPLLVIGGYIGGIVATALIHTVGLDPVYLNNFVLLAMSGYFAAIVRAPLTGIILIFEMTGSLSQMMSLSLVSIVAYIVATLMNSAPIYESLLDRLLRRMRGKSDTGEADAADAERPATGEKTLFVTVVQAGSALEHALIRDIEWPRECLLVAIRRGRAEIIPKGKTQLCIGDEIVALADEERYRDAYAHLNQLCEGA